MPSPEGGSVLPRRWHDLRFVPDSQCIQVNIPFALTIQQNVPAYSILSVTGCLIPVSSPCSCPRHFLYQPGELHNRSVPLYRGVIYRSPEIAFGTKLTVPLNDTDQFALNASIQRTSFFLSGCYCRNDHGTPDSWKMKRQRLSPAWTTRLNDVPVVRLK
ncbi:DUF4113 domain-containing protein [Serratia proteamaculans]|uniref:DUF4113 domain-containing protein n=1 Tax=Serratia proteamaculans TaxID=28151 RepID=A0A5Q2VCR8_SERPR|nr:DUF4113 domain-containing protein [Serratia proteamaculans]